MIIPPEIEANRNLSFLFILVWVIFKSKGRSGKVSAQPHTIVKQICFPNGNVLFLSLFSLFKY